MKSGIYYDLSNEDYHSGDGVSKSQLDLIDKCPALYQWYRNAPIDHDKVKSFDMGTAFHCLTLEPDEFDKRFIISPNFNRRSNEGKAEEKAFLKSVEDKKQIIITEDDKKKLLLMRDSAMAHPLAKWLLEADGVSESSIYWKDKDTGINCRCRPDKIITQHHWAVDVKTTADIERLSHSFYDYRYHVQDPFYSDGYKSHFNDLPTFVFLVVSTSINCGRYPVGTFILDPPAKNAGRNAYKSNLNTLSECLAVNEFPSLQTLSLPYWAKELKND